MKNKAILVSLILVNLLYAQSVENELFKKIQIKIEKDTNYLATYKIKNFPISKDLQFDLDEPLLNDNIKFEKSDLRTNYTITFMKHPVNPESFIILDIIKTKKIASQTPTATTQSQKKIGGGTTKKATQSEQLIETRYIFKQLYMLQNSKDETQKNIFKKNIYNPLLKIYDDFYLRNEDNLVEVPYLSKKIDSGDDTDTTIINTTAFDDGGYSSENNSLFLDYYKTNGSFYYPHKGKNKLDFESLRDTSANSVQTNITAREQDIARLENVNLHLNFNFSRLTFQHPIMRKFFGDSDDNDGLSLEISTEEKIMNVVPWASLSTTIAGRTLFMLGGKETKPEDKYFLDTRVFYKLRTNTAELVKDLPFVVADDPKLNFSNRLGIEFNMTRELALPFLNFYLALGAKEFNDPYVGFYENGQIYSYFTMTQARAVMSFYWNTSGDDVHRFRLDLGGVYYDKFKVLYDPQSPIQNSSNIDFKDLDLKVSDIQKQDGQIFPMIEIHFNFVPNKNELFGVSLRAFDNIGRLSGWLKLLDFDSSVLRFEATYISQPMGRKPREWETKGGTIMQLNYRYGM